MVANLKPPPSGFLRVHAEEDVDRDDAVTQYAWDNIRLERVLSAQTVIQFVRKLPFHFYSIISIYY